MLDSFHTSLAAKHRLPRVGFFFLSDTISYSKKEKRGKMGQRFRGGFVLLMLSKGKLSAGSRSISTLLLNDQMAKPDKWRNIWWTNSAGH